MKIQYPTGATPLDTDELEALLLPLKTQEELNKAEKQAIFECRIAIQKSRKLKSKILTVSALKELHNKMLSPVWEWAGRFRTTEKNIGVSPHQIQIKLHELCENCSYRLAGVDERSWPEFAAHFHHTLVYIHPFPNGNGRLARLATDVLSWKLKLKEPTWGRGDLGSNIPERIFYIDALKSADKGELKQLIDFMFS